MPYREQLPKGCPPSDATEVQFVTVVYRLISKAGPGDLDFDSHTKRGIAKPEHNPCNACGLSVYKDANDVSPENLLPGLKKKKVCKVVLNKGAGHLKQTYKPSHHTWWPYVDFVILDACEVI